MHFDAKFFDGEALFCRGRTAMIEGNEDDPVMRCEVPE